MKCRVKTVLFSIIAILPATATLSANAQTVSFAQITDAHIFDSAKHRFEQGANEDYVDNRSSLAWAIYQINHVVASGKHIDFVVFTGDFGLEGINDPLTAADEVAPYFRALLVKTILLVPGNNDVPGEDPSPASLAAYNRFIGQLRVLLTPPQYQIVDLTQTTYAINGIRLVGLNSATFKNDYGNPNTVKARQSRQGAELDRVMKEVLDKQPEIIFTHIPNLEDPSRDKNKVKRAWNRAPLLEDKWSKIVNRDEVLGVFAGHFHDARRSIYMHDYSWASQQPQRIEGNKTWIAPPLAVKFQFDARLQARGFLVATVSADGSVSVVPKWFAFADPDTLPDKGSLLLQAQAEESHAYWARAASFYSQALTSTDPNVRAGAEQGYLNAREKIHSSHIFKKEAFAAGVLLLLFVIGGVATVRHRRGRLVIETPSKITPDAPVDLFASAIITSALEIQATFRAEEQQRNRIVSLLQDSSDQKVFMLSGGAHAIQQIADSLPDIRGVKAGNLVKALFAGFNFLFNWRIESGLAIYADGSGSAYANLRWWWSTTSTWVESVSIPATTLAEEPPRAVVIRSLAWRIASDILSKDLTSRHGS